MRRRRKFNEEKCLVIREKTQKLLTASHIREIQYLEWLTNVVLVKKASEKWRMCVDFTNFNKVCPKDPYPLPNIDSLVDNASGCGLLSFLDAFSEYHQIGMHPGDENKTTFIIRKPAIATRSCLSVQRMLGVTYQRLMDKILLPMLGWNVQAYVDDMVVTSVKVDDHITILEELFATVGVHNLKLNPEKCVFGVRAEKFLDFLLSERGVEANPEKCSLIMEMRSPKNIKEVQRLTGCMTTLSRFLLDSDDKGYLYFQCLKENDRFTWTQEYEEAFAKLKEYLSRLPIPHKPAPGLLICLYFSLTD